jgi:uncharacterized membrane protein
LTLDILLKKLVRGPLSRLRGVPVLLIVALPPVNKSRGMEAKVVTLVLVVAVGMLIATRMTPVTTKIGVVLRFGKVSGRHY